MRLYESKSHSSGLQLTGSCKAVLLLDLAASQSGQAVDKVSLLVSADGQYQVVAFGGHLQVSVCCVHSTYASSHRATGAPTGCHMRSRPL